MNWGVDSFTEERCFPELFPYGVGGYISSNISNPNNEIGFAKYCVAQLMSCDAKFRNDPHYLFFLLIVKELIMIKRSLSTYLRQATRMPNLRREDVITLSHENLNRYNRTFQVFKTMRGTSPYYEESKKSLMALLRQFGGPSVFFTLSMAEFQWDSLFKEIMETVYRRKFTDEELAQIPQSERNKIISENYVQTTIHFQKRIEKLFALMQHESFFGPYHVAYYFYRIEFQQRGGCLFRNYHD